MSRCSSLSSTLLLALFGMAGAARADGMQPASPIVILYEDDGQADMMVRNTDAAAALLHTAVQDIPEDPDTVVIATPPVARVEPGQEQLVRFFYQGPALQTQRLKRVIFEGIGQRLDAHGRAVVGVSVRQNLPLLLHPRGLPRHRTPWTLLHWQLDATQLTVRNDSAYVVRLQPTVTLQPSGRQADLGRAYLLPGQSIAVAVQGTVPDGAAPGDTAVALAPASVYGFAVDTYLAPLQ